MVMTLALYRLGRLAVRRRRLVLAAWVVAALLVIGLAQAAGGKTSDAFEIPGVEAQRALDLLQAEFPSAAGTSERGATSPESPAPASDRRTSS